MVIVSSYVPQWQMRGFLSFLAMRAYLRTAAWEPPPSSQASPQTRPDHRIHEGYWYLTTQSIQDTKRARRFEIRVVVITPPHKTALRTPQYLLDTYHDVRSRREMAAVRRL